MDRRQIQTPHRRESKKTNLIVDVSIPVVMGMSGFPLSNEQYQYLDAVVLRYTYQHPFSKFSFQMQTVH